jgi:hypothetical protein
MAVRLSALRAGYPLTPQDDSGIHFSFLSVRGWVDPRAIVRLEGLGQSKKNPSHRDSIPRPSSWAEHSASTNYATASSEIIEQYSEDLRGFGFGNYQWKKMFRTRMFVFNCETSFITSKISNRSPNWTSGQSHKLNPPHLTTPTTSWMAEIYLNRIICAMLGGSLVTTAWHVFRLRMEETASRYGG